MVLWGAFVQVVMEMDEKEKLLGECFGGVVSNIFLKNGVLFYVYESRYFLPINRQKILWNVDVDDIPLMKHHFYNYVLVADTKPLVDLLLGLKETSGWPTGAKFLLVNIGQGKVGVDDIFSKYYATEVVLMEHNCTKRTLALKQNKTIKLHHEQNATLSLFRHDQRQNRWDSFERLAFTKRKI